jgi:hypothetical protein
MDAVQRPQSPPAVTLLDDAIERADSYVEFTLH